MKPRMVILTEVIELSPKEIRILKRLHKKGKSFLYLTGEIMDGTKDELLDGLEKKKLIEERYYIGGVDTGYYWYISSKGRKVLKQLKNVKR
jgi:hypothetical protein